MAWVLLIVGIFLCAGGFFDLSRPVPKQQEKNKTGARIGASVMLGFGLLMTFAGLVDLAPGRSSSATAVATETKPKPYVGEAWVMCQEFIGDKLISPASAKYPAGNGSDYVTYLGPDRYRFKAHVDSQNAVGVMLRTKFDCTISNTGPERWRLDNLTLE